MAKFSIILLTTAAFLAAIGQLLLRVGAHGRESLLAFVNWNIFFGLFLYATSTCIWIYTLSHERLVEVYAFTALTFVLVYLGGVVLLDEHVDLRTSAGVAFVLFGLYLIARPGSSM